MGDQRTSEFGPAEAASPAAAPFSVTGPAAATLDGDRRGVTSFVVANTTGRPVTARLLVQPVDGADVAWFTLDGPTDRPMTVAATLTAQVRIAVPPAVPAGKRGVRLDAALEEAPEQLASGPTVAFTVSEPKKKPPFRWWIIAVIVGALLVLGGGAWAIWALVVPHDDPTSNSQVTAPPAAADKCRTGYVYRLARPDDLVCVLPASAAQVINDNDPLTQAQRKYNPPDPTRPYGVDECLPGWVWRNAYSGDVACVTVDTRTRTAQENADASTHAAP
ncbi:hypothetical protein ACH3VR_00175 [Microbacterium sp. B2969]|uniref:Serine/threonine protein kinase n=1 Tax=Microbacterium alkaliflavum TaxID=3248839 RepID=A0ABW7Q1S2_9MICO